MVKILIVPVLSRYWERFAHHVLVGVNNGALMDTLTAGAMMGFLILLQMAIIRECIKMKSQVSTDSTDLKSELSNLSNLLDEAIDFLADGGNQPSPMIAQAGGDLKETLLTAFMSKMMMPQTHGIPQEPQERQIYEDDSQTTQE